MRQGTTNQFVCEKQIGMGKGSLVYDGYTKDIT